MKLLHALVMNLWLPHVLHCLLSLTQQKQNFHLHQFKEKMLMLEIPKAVCALKYSATKCSKIVLA